MSTGPAAEYRTRLDRRTAERDALRRVDAKYSYIRLAVFGAAVLTGIAIWREVLPGWALLAPVAVFVWLVVRHDAVIKELKLAERLIVFYERGLARLEDRWTGTGETGERFADAAHPYAIDLDLFGRGSLFELLSLARTRAGEQMLADWLLRPADPSVIHARHDAVRELTPHLDLREHLAVAGADVRASVNPDALTTWAEEPPTLAPSWLRGLSVLTTVGVVAGLGSWLQYDAFFWFLIALALQGVVTAVQRARVEHLLHASDAPARELGILLHVLARMERERFTSARLVALRDELTSHGQSVSTAIHRLQMLMEMHDWEHNLVFAPIAAMLMWDTHLAWAIQRWRIAHGTHVRRWLAVAGEFEAFSSLSAYRYEHPDDPFPEIVGDAAAPRPGALFDGVALGHPLLPAARMVRNDIRLDASGVALVVISGSNMSGKSTMLRTVGVNTVLALAGAPVRATSLRLTPVAIGATLRIQDSLQEGRSRFYAEITRIRELADLAGEPGLPERRGGVSRIPLLFLLDELLHGTNSHDRLVGASGVLTGLVGRGAIGLITTHDLALTAIVDALGPRAVNAHFEDWFDAGEIRFDYRMKPGPVARSNAIALMRAVGLDVKDT